MLESMIDHFRHSQETVSELQAKTAKSVSRATAIRRGRRLTGGEMQQIVNDLMACSEPGLGIDGRPCSWLLSNEEIQSRMRRNNA